MKQGLQLLLAALLVLVVGFAGYRLVFSEDGAVAVEVVEAEGDVHRTDATGHRSALAPGDRVEAQQTVHVGEDGRAVLGMGDDTRLELEARSAVQILEVDASGVRVELEQGRVSARVRAGGTPLGLSSRGRAVYVEDGETTVAVDQEGALAVEPGRGSVRVEGVSDDGSGRSVEAGQRLTSLPGGEPVIEAIPVELLLEVAFPGNPTTRAADVLVEGRTAAYAEVHVGDGADSVAVRADADGRFRASVPLDEGENQVRVRARDALGNTREDELSIIRDSTAPTITGSEVQWGP
ncbi:MAG: FecR domain-containing protein [Alphaproteobacteria bacterium]|nr:FecR domain-containing protein [Alphaproteobacteria bacterium]